MAKVARKATKKAEPAQRHKLTRVYTAWHPVLVVLLEHVLPGGFYQCISEFQLSREPLRIDVVVVRRSRPGTPPAPHLLASVVADLADHITPDELEALRCRPEALPKGWSLARAQRFERPKSAA